MPKAVPIILSVFLCYVTGLPWAFGEEEERVNLTDTVIPIITDSKITGFMAGGELFANRGLTTRGEFQYSIRVKNQTDDPIDADSLILILDRVKSLDHTWDIMKRIEVVGYDGLTPEGKPYFRIPVDSASELSPHAVSNAVEVRIQNPNLLRLDMPSFQVWGIPLTGDRKLQELGQILIKKGILTTEEAAELLDSSSVNKNP